MAYTFTNAANPAGIPVASGAVAMYELKELLKRAGWTVPASGTGTSGTWDTSDLITSAGVLDGTRAWFAIEDPAGVRSFTVQRVSNAVNFRVKYAAEGGFSGTINENTTGSSAEEIVILGTGTDASPTGGTFSVTSGSPVMYSVADDEAPYGFCADIQEGGTHRGIFFLDPLRAGSYNAADTDPAVVAANFSIATAFLSNLTNAFAWLQRASGTGALAGIGAGTIHGWGAASNRFPGSAGQDPETGDDITYPVTWGRSPTLGAPNGWKGVSSLFEWVGSSRIDGDTFTVDTARDRIVIAGDGWAMPWNGENPTV